MTELRRTDIPVPYGGMNLSTGPDALDEAEAPWIENFLVGDPGQLVVRGEPIQIVEPVSGFAPGDHVRSLWHYRDGNQKLNYVTRSKSSDITKVRWDQTPWRDPTSYSETELETVIATENNPASFIYGGLAGRPTRVGANTYGFQCHDVDNPTQSLADLGWTDGPTSWFRPLIGLPSVTNYATNAPHTCQAVKGHLNRLWTLGGYAPGAAPQPYEPNTLFYSDECHLSLLPNSINSWKDNVTGLLNRTVLGATTGEYGVAFALIDQNLVIFTNRSIWVLYGDNPDNFTLKQIVNDRGCIEPHSVYEADGGVYFASKHGIEFFDGSVSRIISNPVKPLVDEYIDQSGVTQFGLSIKIGSGGPGLLRVHLERYRTPTTAYRRSLVMNRETGGWVVFSGTGYNSSTAFDDEYWVNLDGGVDHHDFVPRRDNFSGKTSDWYPIQCNAKIIYRRMTPSSPAIGMQLHRVSLDTYATDHAVVINNDDAAPYVWDFGMRESTGDVILPPSQIRAQSSDPASTRYITGRRTVWDIHNEAHDLQPTLSYTYQNTDENMAKVYDGYVEWSPTNQRRSTRPR